MAPIWCGPDYPPLFPDSTFVALDFETADYAPDSVCAIGVVRVERLQVRAGLAATVRPLRRRILFSHLHGLTWEDLKDSPTFGEAWPQFGPLFDGAEAIAAHNAEFDRRVLYASCAAAGLAPPPLPFVCTVRLARRHWGLPRADLPSVCRQLGIGLVRHHHAGYDAVACAQIVIAALRSAMPPSPPSPDRPRPPADPRPRGRTRR